MRLTDLTLGLLTLAGGVAIYLSAMNFSAIPGQSYGAGTMPRAIALVTVVLGLVMIARSVIAGDVRLGLRLADWVRDRRAGARALFVLLMILLYILVSPVAGFVPTALIAMTGAMLVLGTRLPTAILISGVATIVIQQSFGRLLLVPLPRSDFLTFLW